MYSRRHHFETMQVFKMLVLNELETEMHFLCLGTTTSPHPAAIFTIQYETLKCFSRMLVIN